MLLSEWREFPLTLCLEKKKKLDRSRPDVVEIARVPDMLPSCFLSGRAKDYQHPGITIPLNATAEMRALVLQQLFLTSLLYSPLLQEPRNCWRQIQGVLTWLAEKKPY